MQKLLGQGEDNTLPQPPAKITINTAPVDDVQEFDNMEDLTEAANSEKMVSLYNMSNLLNNRANVRK